MDLSGTLELPIHRASRPTAITVVVPTYHEVENIPHLVARLAALRESSGIAVDG
jgi:hypothetical protein